MIAAEITADSLGMMVTAAEHEVAAAGVTDRPDVVLADAATGTRTSWRRSSIAASRSASRPTPTTRRFPAGLGQWLL
jgi:hypothetical protein